jgi:hypothetical protein
MFLFLEIEIENTKFESNTIQHKSNFTIYLCLRLFSKSVKFVDGINYTYAEQQTS